jgi:hypothetical protein
MFGSLIRGVVNVAADIVSPVTELVGVDKKTLLGLAAVGLTVYEISEVTGLAVDVVQKVLEE